MVRERQALRAMLRGRGVCSLGDGGGTPFMSVYFQNVVSPVLQLGVYLHGVVSSVLQLVVLRVIALLVMVIALLVMACLSEYCPSGRCNIAGFHTNMVLLSLISSSDL
jgi:hypothetical protein